MKAKERNIMVYKTEVQPLFLMFILTKDTLLREEFSWVNTRHLLKIFLMKVE